MNPKVNGQLQREWSWLIAIYLFLGGIGGGAYTIAAVNGFLGDRAGHSTEVGLWIGFPALLLRKVVLDVERLGGVMPSYARASIYLPPGILGLAALSTTFRGSISSYSRARELIRHRFAPCETGGVNDVSTDLPHLGPRGRQPGLCGRGARLHAVWSVAAAGRSGTGSHRPYAVMFPESPHV